MARRTWARDIDTTTRPTRIRARARDEEFEADLYANSAFSDDATGDSTTTLRSEGLSLMRVPLLDMDW